MAASDFIDYSFLRFRLSLAFSGLLAHSMDSLDTCGWIVQQYLQQRNDGRALGLNHMTSHIWVDKRIFFPETEGNSIKADCYENI